MGVRAAEFHLGDHRIRVEVFDTQEAMEKWLRSFLVDVTEGVRGVTFNDADYKARTVHPRDATLPEVAHELVHVTQYLGLEGEEQATLVEILMLPVHEFVTRG